MISFTPEELFAHRIERDHAGCWLWQGHIDRDGYGTTTIRRQKHGLHRLAYQLMVGEIPPGLDIDHLCRNRRCCNPGHMEIVTRKENTLRGNAPTAINARKTHCASGHEFTAENTYRLAGRRQCRACNRAAVSRYKSRVAA